MERPIYIPIGNIRKPLGTNGALTINLNEDVEDIIFDLEHFFVFTDGQYLPFFIDLVEDKNDLIVKLEGIDSPQIASGLSGKKIYVSPNQVSEEMKVSVSKFGAIGGFTIYNNDDLLGTIEDIVEYPSQLMIKFTYQGQEKLIPLVDDFIVNLNENQKIIVLSLPEGILDL
jgi:16S rRNA processing protein RimM